MRQGGRAAHGALAFLAGMFLIVAVAPVAQAHRDGCHRWHSCPSDTGSYSCGDAGYVCRYPTYPESQRGSVPDPTYEDYGYTDRTPADRDYGYSDACPLGCQRTYGPELEDGSGLRVQPSTPLQTPESLPTSSSEVEVVDRAQAPKAAGFHVTGTQVFWAIMALGGFLYLKKRNSDGQ